jgi:uncharacterized membrane protein YagU involved in acid resistance
MNRRLAATRAGIAASFTMDLTQWACAALFEARRDPGDLDEETEAIASVVDRLTGLLHVELSDDGNAIAGRAIHYVFGAGFGLAYARLRASWRPIAAGKGLAFGAALFLLSDVVLIPAAHLGRNWFRYSRAERFNALASHLAYAATLEALL